MQYAKLINNNLVLAPNPITISDRQIGNPPGEVYTEQGYKPVYYSDPPEAEPGFIAVPHWEEDVVMGDSVINQVWVIEVEPDEVDAERAMEILFGGEN